LLIEELDCIISLEDEISCELDETILLDELLKILDMLIAELEDDCSISLLFELDVCIIISELEEIALSDSTFVEFSLHEYKATTISPTQVFKYFMSLIYNKNIRLTIIYF